MRKQALLLILICFYIQINAQNWHQEQKIVASDRAVEDQFGISVSINGDYALVGAWMEDHDVLGGNLSSSSGSAYIYKLDGNGNWNQIQKLVASDRSNDDHFGFSVSIYGNYAIVSALREDHNVSGGSLKSNSGSAYIFEKNSSGVWSQVQKIVASDRDDGDEFGSSVSICGNYAVIGAWKEDHDVNGGNTYTSSGSAYIFARGSNGVWSQVQKIVASDRGINNAFGRSVSISSNYIIVGAYHDSKDSMGLNYLNGAGSAYIFERNSNGIWTQTKKIVA